MRSSRVAQHACRASPHQTAHCMPPNMPYNLLLLLLLLLQ
jgi:hypothetical protein